MHMNFEFEGQKCLAKSLTKSPANLQHVTE